MAVHRAGRVFENRERDALPLESREFLCAHYRDVKCSREIVPHKRPQACEREEAAVDISDIRGSTKSVVMSGSPVPVMLKRDKLRTNAMRNSHLAMTDSLNLIKK